MFNTNNISQRTVKAVGLISGGLDSSLAAKLIKDLGVEVYGVYFAMPWGCCDKAKAIEVAQRIGISFIVLQLDERYLEVVRSPRHGYGSAMNPCRDCRVHMFSRAAQYMRHIGADFVFTGEVLGQRPMSQKHDSMRIIEEESGLKGKLLRPLSAHLLEPTEVETNGLIDRKKLLSLNGRGRRPQLELAGKLEIPYNQPAGGCALTDKNFAARMKDTLDHGYRTFRETIALKWGRHYRINKSFKLIVGRDREENEGLIRYAHPDDIIMQLTNNLGPTLILKGKDPSEELLAQAAGIIQHYSRYRDSEQMEAFCWLKSDKNTKRTVKSRRVSESELEKVRV